MLDIFSLLILAASFLVLLALAVIDLRTCLLPNKLVALFAMLGLGFHLSLFGLAVNWIEMAYGAVMGGGILLAIRTVGNYFYKDDTLGLGDVKLMAAAGLWLGPHAVMIALVLGALVGIIHGLGLMAHARLKKKEVVALGDFSLPAGPGFIAGIILMGVYSFKDML